MVTKGKPNATATAQRCCSVMGYTMAPDFTLVTVPTAYRRIDDGGMNCS